MSTLYGREGRGGGREQEDTFWMRPMRNSLTLSLSPPVRSSSARCGAFSLFSSAHDSADLPSVFLALGSALCSRRSVPTPLWARIWRGENTFSRLSRQRRALRA